MITAVERSRAGTMKGIEYWGQMGLGRAALSDGVAREGI